MNERGNCRQHEYTAIGGYLPAITLARFFHDFPQRVFFRSLMKA
jgi:hypothetical protein